MIAYGNRRANSRYSIRLTKIGLHLQRFIVYPSYWYRGVLHLPEAITTSTFTHETQNSVNYSSLRASSLSSQFHVDGYVNEPHLSHNFENSALVQC